MRVSEYYALGRTQPTLDFVDVDIDQDTPVFLSPRALMDLPSEWANECISMIQDFFQTVLRFIKEGKHTDAELLLRSLREPNETHLGLSKGKSRGRALGTRSAHEVWRALSQSEAAKSGLLEDLEDTILLVDGISVDIVSDIATNIIRGPLIRYTKEMCALYGIKLQQGVGPGPMWDPHTKKWFTRFEEMPVTSSGHLLLVPKAVVRKHLEYDVAEYYRYYLLEHLRQQELSSGSSLVVLLKDGRKKVKIKSLIEKYGSGKEAIVRETIKHPEVLDRYKKFKRGQSHRPLSHSAIADVEGSMPPNWQDLLDAVRSVSAGNDDAARYERAIETLLTGLLYPDLCNPHVQHEIHAGRKRIDISYTNMGAGGFFKWLSNNYSAAQIFVECKNYGREVGNPELDQLAGRFSPSRGRFGLLVCRQFNNKTLFIERCRDTAKDDRGFIIPIDDEDLTELARLKTEDAGTSWPLLLQRFQSLLD
jgi:hypothetical protein